MLQFHFSFICCFHFYKGGVECWGCICGLRCLHKRVCVPDVANLSTEYVVRLLSSTDRPHKSPCMSPCHDSLYLSQLCEIGRSLSRQRKPRQIIRIREVCPLQLCGCQIVPNCAKLCQSEGCVGRSHVISVFILARLNCFFSPDSSSFNHANDDTPGAKRWATRPGHSVLSRPAERWSRSFGTTHLVTFEGTGLIYLRRPSSVYFVLSVHTHCPVY